MRICEAIKNPSIRAGLLRSLNNLGPMVEDNLKRYGYILEYAEELKKVKLEIAENYGYWVDKAIKKLEKDAEVYTAENAKKANQIIGEIVGEGKIVVKAKSMVSEEIHLREYLQKLGNEVWETDLGELIIQVANQRPMHVLAPAILFSEKDVIEILRKMEIEGRNAEELARNVREFLREKFKNAHFGISGCNAFSVENARIFLVENEGNIRLATSLPRHYVAIVSIDKLLPDDNFALKSIIVQSAFLGTFPPSYINVNRPRNGQKMYVVFLDNGRSEAPEKLKEQLACIKCGRCQLECPVYQIVGNIWGGETYTGPMGIGWSAITNTSSIEEDVYLCCLCGRCTEICPMKIDISAIVRYLRRNYVKNRSKNPAFYQQISAEGGI